MNRRLVLLVVSLWLMASPRADALPEASVLLKRMQARLAEVCADSYTNRFHYFRTNVVEEFDGNNRQKKRVLKTYQVYLYQGLPRAQLIAIDGKKLSESEQRWQQSQEQRLQKTLTQERNPDWDKPKPWLTDELLARFRFVVTSRTNLNGRPVLTMTFEPRADAPVRNMSDRVINKISGALWVDEAEAEIVRLDLAMSEPVKFWGGILGQIDRFDWTLQRTRSPWGVWFNQLSNGYIQIRKLFATSRFRISEQAFAFGPGDPK